MPMVLASLFSLILAKGLSAAQHSVYLGLDVLFCLPAPPVNSLMLELLRGLTIHSVPPLVKLYNEFENGSWSSCIVTFTFELNWPQNAQFSYASEQSMKGLD